MFTIPVDEFLSWTLYCLPLWQSFLSPTSKVGHTRLEISSEKTIQFTLAKDTTDLNRTYRKSFLRATSILSRSGCVYGVYSCFEKSYRKKCTPPSRKVLWVVLNALCFKEIWKNGTGATDICLGVLRKETKVRNSVLIIAHITFRGLSRANVFGQPSRNGCRRKPVLAAENSEYLNCFLRKLSRAFYIPANSDRFGVNGLTAREMEH